MAVVDWVFLVFYNGFGCYEVALVVAESVVARLVEIIVINWVLLELIEVAVLGGRPECARCVLQ